MPYQNQAGWKTTEKGFLNQCFEKDRFFHFGDSWFCVHFLSIWCCWVGQTSCTFRRNVPGVLWKPFARSKLSDGQMVCMFFFGFPQSRHFNGHSFGPKIRVC